jgi:hypothetical protein
MGERLYNAAQTSDTGWADVKDPRAFTGVVAAGYCHGGQVNSVRDDVLGTYVPAKVTRPEIP